MVKVGTNVITGPGGGLDPARVAGLADEVCAVTATGRRVALVSSGAVGAGIGRLGLGAWPGSRSKVQAAAAVGQAYLIRAYDESFRRHGRHAAQLLLTHEDFDDRIRYLNMRNTLTALFAWGAVPVINENDTVSVDEIRFGDNDRLAALVSNLLQAELLVILSVVDGLRRRDAASGTLGEVIPLVTDPAAAESQVTGTMSGLGTGGMLSKLRAAATVVQAGGSVVISSGRRASPLTDILIGEPVGTLLLPAGKARRARDRWIGQVARPKGHIVVDDGARRALESGAASLLLVGVVDVIGDFGKGDVVGICDRSQAEFARGLARLDAGEVRVAVGLRSPANRHESDAFGEVVHRDHLVLTPPPAGAGLGREDPERSSRGI